MLNQFALNHRPGAPLPLWVTPFSPGAKATGSMLDSASPESHTRISNRGSTCKHIHTDSSHTATWLNLQGMMLSESKKSQS